MNDLLEQFLHEDCTPAVRRLLEDAINDPVLQFPHFDFNRFEITIDRRNDRVRIEDDLDPTEAGKQTVPIDVFLRALERRSAP